MKEIETRIIKIDVDEIRSKLKQLNYQLVKKENQINDIFDFEDKRLLNKKGYARIRTIENLIDNKNYYYMTTKKLISQTPYKVMEENEVLISDGKTGADIFKSLGLGLVESIKKYRESYKYKDTLVEIDINDESFCPFPYIEIETTKEDQLKEVVEALGYNLSDTTSKTIYEILENEGQLKGL